MRPAFLGPVPPLLLTMRRPHRVCACVCDCGRPVAGAWRRCPGCIEHHPWWLPVNERLIVRLAA